MDRQGGRGFKGDLDPRCRGGGKCIWSALKGFRRGSRSQGFEIMGAATQAMLRETWGTRGASPWRPEGARLLPGRPQTRETPSRRSSYRLRLACPGLGHELRGGRASCQAERGILGDGERQSHLKVNCSNAGDILGPWDRTSGCFRMIVLSSSRTLVIRRRA